MGVPQHPNFLFQENGFTHDLKRALNHARFNLAASYQGMAKKCRDVLRDCVSLAEFNLLAGLWFHFFFKVTRIMGHEDFPTFWTTFLFFEAMKSADLPLGQAISS